MTMSVTVAIPTPLRNFTGGRDAVDVSGTTVGEVLDGLLSAHTGLRRHLVQDDGRLRNFVNLYLNDTDIRQLESTATPVATGDVLTSVANGTVADGMAAVAAAHAAAPAWAATPPRERGEILRRSFEAIMDQADDFAELISLEMGKTLAEAKGEVTYGAEFFRWFAILLFAPI